MTILTVAAFPSRLSRYTFNDFNQALRLASFTSSYPDMLVSALATINVQAVANTANSSNKDRGQQFLGDMLTGLLNAFQGTTDGKIGDSTDIAYKVWGVGWPKNGVPGRGLRSRCPPQLPSPSSKTSFSTTF